MNALDWILVAIRWGHALAAVAWVGGGVFYVMVLRPSQRRAAPPGEFNQAVGVEFRGLVTAAIGVLLLSGVVLSVARLTDEGVSGAYVAVLVVKIVLALYMFYVVRFLRHRTYPEESVAGRSWRDKALNGLTSTTAVLIIGVVVFGLADVLSALFEHGLRG